MEYGRTLLQLNVAMMTETLGTPMIVAAFGEWGVGVRIAKCEIRRVKSEE
jgi:hypothetical protein